MDNYGNDRCWVLEDKQLIGFDHNSSFFYQVSFTAASGQFGHKSSCSDIQFDWLVINTLNKNKRKKELYFQNKKKKFYLQEE